MTLLTISRRFLMLHMRMSLQSCNLFAPPTKTQQRHSPLSSDAMGNHKTPSSRNLTSLTPRVLARRLLLERMNAPGAKRMDDPILDTLTPTVTHLRPGKQHNKGQQTSHHHHLRKLWFPSLLLNLKRRNMAWHSLQAQSILLLFS